MRGTLSNTESEPVSQIITIDNLNIDLNNYTVTRHGEEIKLTSKETDILKLFLNNPNRVFTKAQIYSFVWNEEYYGDDNTVNVHISHLRNKLSKAHPDEEYIETIWGMGYKLKS
ncbi:Transcriptional regulatory protein SrrA [compost metagenome]